MISIRLVALAASVAVLGLALFATAPAYAQDPLLHLQIGDPARKDREVPLVLDAITDTADGSLLTPDELAKRLAGARLLLVGEEHTSIEFHRVQARVIEALVAAGRKVILGLEMYPYTAQAGLDAWPAGSQPEEEFITASRWYEHWGYSWHYYRDIFLYARAHRLPLVAVNTPREVVAAVRRKGLEGLTPEERAHIPADIDVDHADHMAFFKATFAGAEGPVHGPGMSDTMWRNMLSAQATWDASMGANAVKALARPENRDAIMIVLVGSGHVAYGVGIERQARKWFDGRIASLIPVAVTRVHGPTVKTAQASYANYLWAVPTEIDTLYPSLGLSMAVGQGETARTVLLVQNGTPAADAGFLPKDVLLSMDGAPIPDKETYSRLMAGKRWGDAATFEVRRGTETVTLRAVFRRRIGQ